MSLKDMLDSLPVPIVQAPMAGSSPPEMAQAVREAGGLGFLALAMVPPDEIEGAIEAFRGRSAAPFGVNLQMAPEVSPDPAEVETAIARLKPWYEAVGVEPPSPPNRYSLDFKAQLAALTRAAPPVASFTFGVFSKAEVAALKDAGTYVVGTATTVAEARAWAEAGADGIWAQGLEAGGHRGTFLKPVEESLVGTLALTATIRAAVDLPVIAAGGIMDGRGVAAVLALGASAAGMGSAFLMAQESLTGPVWRKAVSEAGDDPTALTRAFTGRHARGVENRFMREMKAVEDEVPAYPVQYRLSQPLRAAAEKAGDAGAMPLWAGQGIGLARTGAAGDLVRQWWNEARQAAAELSARTRGGPGGAASIETDPEAGC
ncbi:NAD(P)H-dependent flavin oxidoreductase [Phenylobacterium sp.]|uniref:NAD(P)H-dependent flavin oxidoreductase n=1 Tax=Phenylobacterium sp. TaxID=1871053 RepID=UPI002E3381F5|nr:nitronate monooxygenase [Phenylobacterium sp.]HEX2561788.1 nitronate monooxygenase [Phenylobacterium sp.]